MPVTVRGWNAFYEGWVAALLGTQDVIPNRWRRDVDREGWIEGYRMALETPQLALVREVLLAEKKLGHLDISGDVIT